MDRNPVSELACGVYGVGQNDDGVCLLLHLGPHRVLLDCGLLDLAPLTQAGPPPADAVFCSHAHADHARGLLALHQTFPKLPIYASEVTTHLLPLNWLDNEVPVPPFCQALPWRASIEFLEGVSVTLYPAGHLPGAAAMVFHYESPQGDRPQSYTLFYTGDCFLTNSRLVDGLPLQELRGLSPNVLLLEGTYGTHRYAHRRQQENRLASRISRALEHQQSILMPAAALGLAQELLLLLRSHHHFTGKDFTIWVDRAIATACDRYLEILPHLPTAVQNFARHQSLFWDERIRPRMRRLPAAGTLPQPRSPGIVLVDETTDLEPFYQEHPQNWLILLPEGEAFTPAARKRHVKPDVDTYVLAQHCDGSGTTQLIHNLRPQHVVLVHGEATELADLTALEELQTRYQLHTPAAGSVVDLPIGETFLQPAAPNLSYAGELTETATGVTLTLPPEITDDPRWTDFADTGVLEVRWQGDDLVVRGLTQDDILFSGRDRPQPWSATEPLPRCANCRYYDQPHCHNPESPLYARRVAPDGGCPVFAAIGPEDPTAGRP